MAGTQYVFIFAECTSYFLKLIELLVFIKCSILTILLAISIIISLLYYLTIRLSYSDFINKRTEDKRVLMPCSLS